MGYRPKLSKEIYDEEHGRIIGNALASVSWLAFAGALVWYADEIALPGPQHETGEYAVYGVSTLLGLVSIISLFACAREYRENESALKRREANNYDYWVQGTDES